MKAKKFILALLGMVTALSLSAQTTIKGVVTDESGEPLIGAGVLVEGTSIGTITGVDDTGSLLVDWDNGSGLNVIWGVDTVRKVVTGDERD